MSHRYIDALQMQNCKIGKGENCESEIEKWLLKNNTAQWIAQSDSRV